MREKKKFIIEELFLPIAIPKKISEQNVTEKGPNLLNQPSCLTPDHQVLTDKGWFDIALVIKSHKVATLDPSTNIMTYEYPTTIHQSPYVGDVYEVKVQGVNLVVTPGHKMYVNTLDKKSPGYALKRTDSLTTKQARYKKNGVWAALPYKFELPAITKNSGSPTKFIDILKKELTIEDWLLFFGLWMAEGWVSTGKDSQYIVYISQKKPGIQQIIMDVITKLGYKYGVHPLENATNYQIHDKQLWSYLKPLSVGALNKSLPAWVWELSTPQCNILLNGMIFGDGYVNKKDKTRHYFTGSKQLSLDVSRLILHAGYSATIGLDDAPSRANRTIKGKPILVNNPLWRINIISSVRQAPFTNYIKGTTDYKKVQYDGPIYCITVPNGVFYVQKEGIPVWTGQ